MTAPLTPEQLEQLITFTRNALTGEKFALARNSYYEDALLYKDLPTCLVDAIYSINATYTSTLNVTRRFQEHPTWRALADERGVTLDSLLALYEQEGYDGEGCSHTAATIFSNRQRTSSRNGIRKSDAIEQACRALLEHGVRSLDDKAALLENPEIQRAFRAVPGQSSGVSWNYLLMLVGYYEYVKPDRFILDFITEGTGRDVTVDEAQPIMRDLCAALNADHPHLTPRTLDARIWERGSANAKAMRGKGSNKGAGCE